MIRRPPRSTLFPSPPLFRPPTVSAGPDQTVTAGSSVTLNARFTDGASDGPWSYAVDRSEEHTSELQSQSNLVCRLLLEKKKKIMRHQHIQKPFTQSHERHAR